jgi:HEAT repeat protein
MKPRVDPGLVKALTEILTRLVQSERLGKRELQRAARAARKWITPGWLVALDRAINRGKQRKRAAVYLLGSLLDLPEAKERLEAWMHDSDPDWRAEVIQIVGTQGFVELAPALNDALAVEDSSLAHAYAIRTAGVLRSEANVEALLTLLSDTHRPSSWQLLWAAKDFPHPRFRPALERFFREGTKEQRIIAAWGLGKMGDEEAICYLGEMLDDPDKETPTSYIHGESMRAAQALCDILWSSPRKVDTELRGA